MAKAISKKRSRDAFQESQVNEEEKIDTESSFKRHKGDQLVQDSLYTIFVPRIEFNDFSIKIIIKMFDHVVKMMNKMSYARMIVLDQKNQEILKKKLLDTCRDEKMDISWYEDSYINIVILQITLDVIWYMERLMWAYLTMLDAEVFDSLSVEMKKIWFDGDKKLPTEFDAREVAVFSRLEQKAEERWKGDSSEYAYIKPEDNVEWKRIQKKQVGLARKWISETKTLIPIIRPFHSFFSALYQEDRSLMTYLESYQYRHADAHVVVLAKKDNCYVGHNQLYMRQAYGSTKYSAHIVNVACSLTMTFDRNDLSSNNRLTSILLAGIDQVLTRFETEGKKTISSIEMEKESKQVVVPKSFDKTRFFETEGSKTVSVTHFHKQVISDWKDVEHFPLLVDYMSKHASQSLSLDIKNCEIHFLQADAIDEKHLPSEKGIQTLKERIFAILSTFEDTKQVIFMDKYQDELQALLKTIYIEEDKEWNDQTIRVVVLYHCLDQTVQLEKTVWMFYGMMSTNRSNKFTLFGRSLWKEEDRKDIIIPPLTMQDLKSNVSKIQDHMMKYKGFFGQKRIELATKWFYRLISKHDDQSHRTWEEKLNYINKHEALNEIFADRSNSLKREYPTNELMVTYNGEYMGHVHVNVEEQHGYDGNPFYIVTMIGIRSCLNYLNSIQPSHHSVYDTKIKATMTHVGYPIPKISSLILYGISRVCKHRQTSKRIFYFKVTQPIGFIMPRVLEKNGITGVKDQGIRVDKLIKNMDQEFPVKPFFMDHGMTFNALS